MISIVVPMLNEQQILLRLYGRITHWARTIGDDYEVIAVDDGSRDSTPQILDALHHHDPRWKVLGFSRNFGHQSSVSAGIHYAQGEVVAILDADLQDPPEVLTQMLERWRQGYQVVYAIRTRRKEHFAKRWAYALFYRGLRRVANVDIPLDAGDFCVMDRAVVDVLRTLPERSRFVRGLRSWAGFRQIGVPYERQARHAGDTKYTFAKLVRLANDGLFAFSNVPLKAASALGIGFFSLALLLIAALLAWWASDVRLLGMHPRQAVGWTSLCSLILLLSGIQMLAIGVIGEYLARVFDEVKGRPPWIITRAEGFDWHVPEPRVGWFVPARSYPSSKESVPLRKAG